VPHTDGILRAHGIEHQPDAGIIARVLDRIFPDAPRTGDAWHDLRAATGRTPDRPRAATAASVTRPGLAGSCPSSTTQQRGNASVVAPGDTPRARSRRLPPTKIGWTR
jgi:hypothetical protein